MDDSSLPSHRISSYMEAAFAADVGSHIGTGIRTRIRRFGRGIH